MTCPSEAVLPGRGVSGLKFEFCWWCRHISFRTKVRVTLVITTSKNLLQHISFYNFLFPLLFSVHLRASLKTQILLGSQTFSKGLFSSKNENFWMSNHMFDQMSEGFFGH